MVKKTVLFEAPDISKHQGNVNMKAVRDAGYPAVFLRAGYGKNNVDQKYVVNAQACFNLGIPAGLYWFSYALNEEMAANEGKYAVAQAKKYWKKCPIAFDLEYDSRKYAAQNGVNINKALATSLAAAFLQEVAVAGYTPVLYTNRDYMRNYFDVDKIKAAIPGTVVWFALYSKSIPESELKVADIWQYTSTGKVSGISGNVDLNQVFHNIWNADAVKQADKEQKVNLYIKSFQAAANVDGYLDQDGKKLNEDGKDGPRTQYVRRQIALQAKQAGSSWGVGSTGELVRWLQGRLQEMRYTLSVDGKYGKNTRATVIKFQKDYNLSQDGIAGYNTLQALFYN